MAESPERMGRFRRIVDVAADVVVVADEEEDVAKDRLAGTKAYYRMSRGYGIIIVGELTLKWEDEKEKEFVSNQISKDTRQKRVPASEIRRRMKAVYQVPCHAMSCHPIH
jgi:hypothetical protein